MELADVISRLLADPARRLETGKTCAQSLVNENRGATERTLQSTEPRYSRSPQTSSENGSASRQQRAHHMNPSASLLASAQHDLSRRHASAAGSLPARLVFTSASLRLPVISVGNLTTGGTGKTPLVEWVCRALAAIARDSGPREIQREKESAYSREATAETNPKTQVVVSDGTELLQVNAKPETNLFCSPRI